MGKRTQSLAAELEILIPSERKVIFEGCGVHILKWCL